MNATVIAYWFCDSEGHTAHTREAGLPPGDVPEGESADSYYTRGIAVCL